MPGIIIEPGKSIYWPIPKNACTTMKKYIADRLGILYDLRDSEAVHSAGFIWTEETILGYTNFAFVRHPGIRLYSLFLNKIREGKNLFIFESWKELFWLGMSFGEFLSSVLLIPIMDSDPHFSPQVMQIPNSCLLYKLEEVEVFLQVIMGRYNVSCYNSDWKRAYTADEWYRMVNHYREDFIRFNYDPFYPWSQDK